MRGEDGQKRVFFRLVADVRERAVPLPSEDVERMALDVGDFQILSSNHNLEGEGEENEKEEELVMLIERKTVRDVVASIKDGRAREQRSRCLAAVQGDASRLFYVVEGVVPGWEQDLRDDEDATILRSAVTRMQILHGFGVFMTRNPEDTAALLMHLLDKLPAYVDERASRATRYAHDVKVKKSQNRVAGGGGTELALLQLAAINGVSVKMAEAILEALGATEGPKKVTTIGGVVRRLDAIAAADGGGGGVEEVTRVLSAIPLTKKRRLGKVLASRIVEALGVSSSCQLYT
jgi:ERCC4-type nuclease